MKIRMLFLAALAAHAGFWAASIAVAQTSGASTPSAATAIGRSARGFVQSAAQAGMAEIEMAKVAQQRGNVETKNFADRMIADHGKANQALANIASAKGIAMPTEIASADQRQLAKVKKLRGHAFDNEYFDTQLSAHKHAVSLFRQEADHGKDADLRAFAASTLPTLQEHLKMVTSLSRIRH